MDEIFYWLFNMSIAASIAGIIIALFRLIKRIPRRFFVVLWLIPFLRFWIPFGIGGKYGLMSLLSRFTTKTVTVLEEIPGNFTMTNYTMAASSYFPITYKVDLLSGVFSVASYVWAVIAAALIIAMAIVYITTVSEVKNAEHLHDNVYCSPKISSPAVYGIFRPRIIVPASVADSNDLNLIILHEQRHIRRLDNLFRMIAFLTAAVHWFNPLVWVFLKLYLTDAEIACDESVLSRLPEEERHHYAHALLNVRESKTVFVSSFGGARLRTRIERILSFKRLTFVSAAGFCILAAAIAYILLTNAA